MQRSINERGRLFGGINPVFGRSYRHCIVRNISDGGAALDVEGVVGIPNRFNLFRQRSRNNGETADRLAHGKTYRPQIHDGPVNGAPGTLRATGLTFAKRFSLSTNGWKAGDRHFCV
jgi:hypothetical protein